MLHPIKIYDYLVVARARVLDKVRLLDAAAYMRQFPIGLGSLSRTLTHIAGSEWYYVQRMLDAEVPPYDQWTVRDENPPEFGQLEAMWAKQAEETRAAIRSIKDWDAPLQYQYTNDDGKRMLSTATAADQFTQLFQHEVHHRAQVINMLKQLGHVIGDVDFNSLMFVRREVGGSTSSAT